jgi:hypothetical protein
LNVVTADLSTKLSMLLHKKELSAPLYHTLWIYVVRLFTCGISSWPRDLLVYIAHPDPIQLENLTVGHAD